MKMFAVMIQDETDYPNPEICFTIGSEDEVGLYSSESEAQEMIEHMVVEGFPRENYFIVELKRI